MSDQTATTGTTAPRYAITKEPPISIGFVPVPGQFRHATSTRVYGVDLSHAEPDDLLRAYDQAEDFVARHSKRYPFTCAVQIAGRREIELELARRAEGRPRAQAVNDDHPLLASSDLRRTSTAGLWRSMTAIRDELASRGIR